MGGKQLKPVLVLKGHFPTKLNAKCMKYEETTLSMKEIIMAQRRKHAEESQQMFYQEVDRLII